MGNAFHALQDALHVLINKIIIHILNLLALGASMDML
jgi:hypothetical protein